MKTFNQLLEYLNDAQKAKVDSWLPDKKSGRVYSPNAEKISGHIIPEGQHAITIPAIAHTMRDVHAHLDRHGYSNHDYVKGTTIDKHGRTVSIGKVLQKTGASDALKNGFANDDREGAKSLENHDIIISRHPYHVAEASTNKPWKSCATLTASGKCTTYGQGVGAKKLPNEIAAGTHVAYLVPKLKDGEKTSNAFSDVQSRIDKAVARIYLKPHHSEQSNHTVLNPENKIYEKKSRTGKNIGFFGSVRRFALENFPKRVGEIYKKDKTVYDDDKTAAVPKFDTSDESVHTLMQADNPVARRELRLSKDLSSDQLHKLIDHHDDPKYDVSAMEDLAHNPNLQKSHIDKLISRNVPTVNNILISKHKLAKHHIDNFVNSSVDSTHLALAAGNNNPLTREHLHAILDHSLKSQQDEGKRLSNKRIKHTEEEIHMINSYNPPHHIMKSLLNHPNLDGSHIEKMISADDPLLHTDMIDNYSSKLSDAHVKAIHDRWNGRDTTHLKSYQNPLRSAQFELYSREKNK